MVQVRTGSSVDPAGENPGPVHPETLPDTLDLPASHPCGFRFVVAGKGGGEYYGVGYGVNLPEGKGNHDPAPSSARSARCFPDHCQLWLFPDRDSDIVRRRGILDLKGTTPLVLPDLLPGRT